MDPAIIQWEPSLVCRAGNAYIGYDNQEGQQGNKPMLAPARKYRSNTASLCLFGLKDFAVVMVFGC